MADKLTIILPGLCGACYAITALAFAYEKRPGWALCYFAYALANVGLVWASIAERAQ